MRGDSSYFGMKDIYQSWTGNLSVDEITLPEDIYTNNSIDMNSNTKEAGKTIGVNASKNTIFTILGMFLLIWFMKRRK